MGPMNARSVALALVAACHYASCAPPPAGTGGSKPGTGRLVPNVPKGTPEPGSDRQATGIKDDWNGRERIVNTTPWQVTVVSMGRGHTPAMSDAMYRNVKGDDVQESFGHLAYEGRTRRGALMKARKIAKEQGRTVIVHTAGESGSPDDELIWDRVEPK